MAFTFTFGPDPSVGFAATMNSILAGLLTFPPTATLPEVFNSSDGNEAITLEGTGFAYSTVGSQTILTAGTIDSITYSALVDAAFADLGALSGLNMDAGVLYAALLDEFFGFDMFALENLFLTQDWVFQGNNEDQTLNLDQVTGEGVSFAPSGNDTAFLKGGDDVFAMGEGNDTAYGGTGRDKIYGNEGDDYIEGNGAKDTLFGGEGHDEMYGGSDDDIMHGHADEDVMYGDGGEDIMYGGHQADTMYGGDNDDLMYGGSSGGIDSVYGGAGNDTLFGGNAKDKLFGGDDNDTLMGGIGNDILMGGAGNDLLTDIRGREKMFGAEGDDTIVGGLGDDKLGGGTGADQFIFNGQTDNDIIFDYNVADGDTIQINGTGFLSITIGATDVNLSHSGGNIELRNLTIDDIAEYNALVASIDAIFVVG